MSVTDGGMAIVVIAEHPENAWEPMAVSLSGSGTPASRTHWSNTPASMLMSELDSFTSTSRVPASQKQGAAQKEKKTQGSGMCLCCRIGDTKKKLLKKQNHKKA
jgi:hypothetical protein